MTHTPACTAAPDVCICTRDREFKHTLGLQHAKPCLGGSLGEAACDCYLSRITITALNTAPAPQSTVEELLKVNVALRGDLRFWKRWAFLCLSVIWVRVAVDAVVWAGWLG